MKPLITALLLAAVCAFGAGCRDKETPPEPQAAAATPAAPTPIPPTPTPAPPVDLGEGLSYRVLQPGSGEAVTDGRMATFDMEMKTAAGTSIWSGAFTFQAGTSQAMPGLQKGIVGMTVGEQREVIIPHAMTRTLMGTTPQGLPEGEALTVVATLRKLADLPAEKGS